MFCSKCGNELRGNEKFCGKCGTALESAVSDTAKSGAGIAAQKVIAEAGNTTSRIWHKIHKWLTDYLDTWRQLKNLGEKEKRLWFSIHAGVVLLFCGIAIILAVSGSSKVSEEMGDMAALEQEVEENAEKIPGNENMDGGAAEYEEPAEEAAYVTLEVEGGSCRAGSNCIFGSYEMSEGEGKVGFEWIILEVTDNKALVLSKYILPKLQAFNNVIDLKTAARWDSCSLRTWLNDSFYRDVFTDEQRSVIITTQVGDYDNRMGGSANYTQDKIFCLSVKEARQYINDLGLLVGTFYDTGTPMTWWLRTEAETDMNNMGKYASFVTAEGLVETEGFHNYQEIGVRPAIWIDLNRVSVVSY